MILVRRFPFLLRKVEKNMYFHPKLVWPPATYDVRSRNHSNWPLLNLSQNVRGGWTNSYWNRQVLMFYPLGKPSGFPAVAVWNVRHSSKSCCNLLIGVFAILAMFGGSGPDFFSYHNSWNLTPFCPATLPRLPLPPFSFVIFTAGVNCSNIGKNPPNVVNFFEKSNV